MFLWQLTYPGTNQIQAGPDSKIGANSTANAFTTDQISVSFNCGSGAWPMMLEFICRYINFGQGCFVARGRDHVKAERRGIYYLSIFRGFPSVDVNIILLVYG
jgi:hypothetical protein